MNNNNNPSFSEIHKNIFSTVKKIVIYIQMQLFSFFFSFLRRFFVSNWNPWKKCHKSKIKISFKNSKSVTLAISFFAKEQLSLDTSFSIWSKRRKKIPNEFEQVRVGYCVHSKKRERERGLRIGIWNEGAVCGPLELRSLLL